MIFSPLLLLIASAQSPLDGLRLPPTGLSGAPASSAIVLNPSLLAYDRDAFWGLYTSQDAALNKTLSFTAGADHGGLVISRLVGDKHWNLRAGVGQTLVKRVSLGAALDLELNSGARNLYLQSSASWRPTPWLSGALVASVPSPLNGEYRSTTVNMDLTGRLPDGRLEIYAGVYDALQRRSIGGGLSLRPTPRTRLFGRYDTLGQWRVGLEVSGGKTRAGGSTDARSGALWLASTDVQPAGPLARGRVYTIDLRSRYPLQPDAGLLGADRPLWSDLLRALHALSSETDVAGVAITLGGNTLSWAQADELLTELRALSNAGTQIAAYLDGYPSNVDYLVASIADTVSMHPAGTLELTGLSSERLYYGELFSTFNIEAQFVKRSEYKSAPEGQTASQPSPHSLEQSNALLDDLFSSLTTTISANRSLKEPALLRLIDEGPFSASDAQRGGLVDQLQTHSAFEEGLSDAFKRPVKISPLNLDAPDHSDWHEPLQIAIIPVEGVITRGYSNAGGLLSGSSTGAQSVINLLEQAASNSAVVGVVLRVDSPGGSAFASEEIWRVLASVKKDKPVVVSMGSVAASGGYYIAANAHEIWAEPNTITGSIGVYSGQITYGGLLSRLGVQSSTLTRGENAAIHSSLNGWSDKQRAQMDTLVDQTYALFKRRVADGRGLNDAQVEAVARGRVWSGKRAQANGLVDHLGGLTEAIDACIKRAEVSPHAQVEATLMSESQSLLQSLEELPTVGLSRALLGTMSTERALPHVARGLLTIARFPSERVWLLSPIGDDFAR